MSSWPIHQQQLELYGGQDGFTDKGVSESAFNRARFRAMYEDPDIAEVSADYWYGLVTTQGFMDGNKRTGANAAIHFLMKNGYILEVEHEEIYTVSMAIANKQMTPDELANWIRDNLVAVQ